MHSLVIAQTTGVLLKAVFLKTFFDCGGCKQSYNSFRIPGFHMLNLNILKLH